MIMENRYRSKCDINLNIFRFIFVHERNQIDMKILKDLFRASKDGCGAGWTAVA